MALLGVVKYQDTKSGAEGSRTGDGILYACHQTRDSDLQIAGLDPGQRIDAQGTAARGSRLAFHCSCSSMASGPELSNVGVLAFQ